MRRRAPRRAGPLAAVGAAAAAALLATLAACSGEGPPTDASDEDFCSAFNLLSDADSGADFRELAQRLRDVGTPADITSDGRAGFEVVIRVAGDLDSDASLEELEDPNVSSREVDQAKVFLDYGTTTCKGLDGGPTGP